MKNKIGFIGIGQAGGNIVDLMDKKGYKTFAINTSKEDLSLVDIENKYLIPESHGCNRDREKGIEYAKRHHSELIGLTEEYLGECDIIYTVYSTGGGTGSGIGVILTEILSINYLNNKIVGSVCILPSLTESIKVQLNAYNCFTHLTKLKTIGGILVIDNDKDDKIELNNKFVELFDSYIDLPNHTSDKGNIDYAEIREMLSTRGCILIAQSQGQSGVISSIKNSIFADIETDRKVMYMALSLNSEIDIKILEDNIGVPYDTFINYNKMDSSVIVASGVSFPKTRLESIKRKLDGTRVHIEGLLENTFNSTLENKLDWVRLPKEVQKESVLDFESIFKSY